MRNPDDPQSPRLEQPPLFETPADPACQAPPSEAPSSSGCPRLRTANRRQIVFRTAALDELIPLDHPARIVWDFVEGLDLSPLYDRIKAVERAPGRAPIDPKILMSLWLYATLEGIGSARQIDELCRTHDAFRWIAGDVSTNYHTLSDFRTRHVELLDKLLTDHVAVLIAEGLVDLNRVAQDGMRVRATPGPRRFAVVRPWRKRMPRPRRRSRRCGTRSTRIRGPRIADKRKPVSEPLANAPRGSRRHWSGCRSWRPRRSPRTEARLGARRRTRRRPS